MKKQFSLAVKIGVVFLALIGALLVGTVVTLIAVDWYRSSARNAPEGIKRMHDLYGGHVVKEGLILRQVNKSSSGVTASYSLLQTVFDHEIDTKNRLVVIGWRDVKTELVEKFERGELDVEKFGATASLEALVDAHAPVQTSAGLIQNTGKGWESSQWAADFVSLPDDDDFKPRFQVLQLAANVPGLAVVSPTETQYFAVVGKDFKSVFSVTTAYDDLDECLADEAAVQQRAAERSERAASAAEAASSAASSADGEKAEADAESEEEDEHDHPAEYVCARFKAEVSVLSSEYGGFKELKVTVQGRSHSLKDYRREIPLRYEPQEREYQLQRNGGAWVSYTELFDEMLSD